MTIVSLQLLYSDLLTAKYSPCLPTRKSLNWCVGMEGGSAGLSSRPYSFLTEDRVMAIYEGYGVFFDLVEQDKT